MQSFPSSTKNDGRAAFSKHYDINKNNEEDEHTYAPKYARFPPNQNNVNRISNHELTQKAISTSNSKNNENYEQAFALNKKEIDSTKQSQKFKSNKGNLRRPNSAIAYRDSNYTKQADEETTQNLIDFNIESFLNRIQAENESSNGTEYKPKKIKKKSKTRPTSPTNSSGPFTALPQQFVKLPEKKKENNKASIAPRSTDYSHLNGKELFKCEPNMEKFATRLTKKSRKDAVLQRAILAKYSQNQVEYIGLNKEKKRSILPEKLDKKSQSNDNSSQLDECNDDESSFKTNNDDDSYEFNYTDTSISASSSTNQQQQNQDKNDKNKNKFSKNEDKFCHLNYRMTSSINYNELAKAQSKYTKKIKDNNKANKNNIKEQDNKKEPKSTVVPPRLFFTRTPLFDDPENPKQRETQRILLSRPLQNPPKERASSSRIYFHDSNIKKDTNNFNQNDLTPQVISNEQTLGPTPQTKESNSGTLPMLNSPQQRPLTNLSIMPPHLFLSTPHSKSYHNSARKNNPSSLLGTNNKDNNDISLKKSNKPPIIPNSRSNSALKSNSNNIDNKKVANKYTDDLYERNDFPNSSRSVKTSYSGNTRTSLNSTGLIAYDNLAPVPRAKHSRNRSSSHRSLIVGSDKDKLFSALAKLHNFSDSSSPPTPTSSNSTNSRWQNNQGIFKLNPILPTKKQKEEKNEEKEAEEDEKQEKAKPIDSITFQMTALEKFKKDKKRKQLEEKGIYHYKRETIQVKNDKQKDEDNNNDDNKDQFENDQSDADQIDLDDSSKDLSFNTQTSIQNDTESPISSNISDDDNFNDYDEKEQSQYEDTEINPSELTDFTEK